ncbi:UNVERIFIED_CONTAM: hypothetical protein NCL1_63647 [Trichonephila clavipes]
MHIYVFIQKKSLMFVKHAKRLSLVGPP